MGGNDPDQKMHTYEVRPREDHHGVDLIPTGFHSVACGMASQTQSAIPSTMPSFATGHTRL